METTNNSEMNPVEFYNWLLSQIPKAKADAIAFVESQGNSVIVGMTQYSVKQETETKIIKDNILDPKVRAAAVAYGQTKVTFKNVDLSAKWLAEQGITPETNPEIFEKVVKEKKLAAKALTARDMIA